MLLLHRADAALGGGHGFEGGVESAFGLSGAAGDLLGDGVELAGVVRGVVGGSGAAQVFGHRHARSLGLAGDAGFLLRGHEDGDAFGHDGHVGSPAALPGQLERIIGRLRGRSTPHHGLDVGHGFGGGGGEYLAGLAAGAHGDIVFNADADAVKFGGQVVGRAHV